MGAALGLAFRALITTLVNLFGTWKVFAFTLVTGTFGIVLYNLLCEVVGEVLEFTAAAADQGVGDLPSGLIQFGGVGAWIAHTMNVEGMISLTVTVVAAKWLVVKIPFLKW